MRAIVKIDIKVYIKLGSTFKEQVVYAWLRAYSIKVCNLIC